MFSSCHSVTWERKRIPTATPNATVPAQRVHFGLAWISPSGASAAFATLVRPAEVVSTTEVRQVVHAPRPEPASQVTYQPMLGTVPDSTMLAKVTRPRYPRTGAGGSTRVINHPTPDRQVVNTPGSEATSQVTY